jgi:hypothetical protein
VAGLAQAGGNNTNGRRIMMAWQALQPGSSYPSYPAQPGRKPSIACPSPSIMSVEDMCEKRNEHMTTKRAGRRQWNRIGDVAAIGVAIGFIAFLTQHPTAGFDLGGAYAPAASGNERDYHALLPTG